MILMQPSNISAARRFVALVMTEDNPTIEALARCLDELALSYYGTPFGMPDDHAQEPPTERIADADIAARFPQFGFYSVADPTEVAGEVLTGDAVDDIIDITNDLREILWRFENVGENDANWNFRLLFQSHWGVHLRNLSRYLHSIQFG
jgi:hypothetical protein